jgi:hypothetical protein
MDHFAVKKLLNTDLKEVNKSTTTNDKRYISVTITYQSPTAATIYSYMRLISLENTRTYISRYNLLHNVNFPLFAMERLCSLFYITLITVL